MASSLDVFARRYPFAFDDFQLAAMAELECGRSVLVAAPTGTGKTLVAEYAIQRTLSAGQRVFYTTPIKALSNQKYRDFHTRYGAATGLLTGDVVIQPTGDGDNVLRVKPPLCITRQSADVVAMALDRSLAAGW